MAAMEVHILPVHHNPETAADSILAVVVVRHIRTLAGAAAAGDIRMEAAAEDKEPDDVAVVAVGIVLEEDIVHAAGTGPGDTDTAAADIGLEVVVVLRTVPEVDTAATAAVEDIVPVVAVEEDIDLAGVPGEDGSRVHRRVKVRVPGVVEEDIALDAVPVGDRETLCQRRYCQLR